MMWVEEVMTRITSSLNEGSSCLDALRRLRETESSGCSVVDRTGKLIGIVTTERLVEVLADKNCTAAELSCLEAMDGNPVILKPDWSLGEAWTYKFEVAVVREETGRIIGVLSRADLAVALFREVEYHAKDQVREFEAILGAAQNGIIMLDNAGRVTTFNNAIQRFSKVSRERAIGHHILDLHILDVSVVFGLMETLETGKSEYGKKIHVGRKTYVLHRDPIIESDRIIGAICVLQDVSEIEEVSKELMITKELNDEFEAIVKSFSDGIIVTDAEGIILRYNKPFEKLSLSKAQNLLGKSIQEVEELGYVHSIVELVRQRRQPVTITENKRNHCLLITASPVVAKKNLLRVVVNLRDLTRLNQWQQDLLDAKFRDDKQLSETEEAERRRENGGLIGSGQDMQRVFELVRRVAKVDSTVLLLGESGVGKEEIGKLLHAQSNRAEGPFIKINCGSIPEYLLESELFGYEGGAFTGARREGKIGMFDLAHNGTLLLDEIGDFPLGLQPKLLRVLQEREFIPVGGTAARRVNVRILAATHRNLEEMIKAGQFREDLFFRLNVVPIMIPPLRYRREDIIPLVYHFRNKFCEKYGFQREFASEVIEAFLVYDWPGNVRELENMVERLIVVASEELIQISQLPKSYGQNSGKAGGISVHTLMPLKEAVDEVERQLIDKALEKHGSTYKAAAALGVNQSTIVRRMARFRRRDEEPPVLH